MKKNIILLLVYLILIVIIPYLVFYYLYTSNYMNKDFDVVGNISFFVHFIAPVIFILPYKKANLNNKKQKLIFILFGFIIPFAIIYFLAYLDFQKNFHPSF
jgi:hypothetical protein